MHRVQLPQIQQFLPLPLPTAAAAVTASLTASVGAAGRFEEASVRHLLLDLRELRREIARVLLALMLERARLGARCCGVLLVSARCCAITRRAAPISSPCLRSRASAARAAASS